jgi:rubrerythrin
MTLEEAIRTAISYETNIRDLYIDAAETAPDPVGKKLFEMLGNDEQSHLDYLNVKLAQWQKTGQITVERLESVVPPLENIRKDMGKLQDRMDKDDRKSEKQMLSKALKVEVETSNFYKKMVSEMSDEAKTLFANFLEIEERHTEAIQIQLDYLSHTGYWFGFKEFDMEG